MYAVSVASIGSRSARPSGTDGSHSLASGATLYAGREKVAPDFDWAGLDYMFPAPFSGASYRINVQEAR